MIHPRRLDGQPINACSLPDGRVYVDFEPEVVNDRWGGGPVQLSRGGPEHSPHHCRFEDYGLADGLVRCRKCGLVRHDDNL